MYYFRIFLRANIDNPIMDKYNIKAKNASAAVDIAKETMFRRLSLQGKHILENDIEVLLVTDMYGEKIDITLYGKE